MARLDCSKTDTFLKEFNRMCESFGACADCDFSDYVLKFGGLSIGNCRKAILTDLDKTIKIVQTWSDEHPEPFVYTCERCGKEYQAAKSEDGYAFHVCAECVNSMFKRLYADFERFAANKRKELGFDESESADEPSAKTYADLFIEKHPELCGELLNTKYGLCPNMCRVRFFGKECDYFKSHQCVSGNKIHYDCWHETIKGG